MRATEIQFGKTYMDNGGRRVWVMGQDLQGLLECQLDDGQITALHPDLIQFEYTGGMREVTISKKWKLKLPEHRAARGHEWDTWEQERLASMHKHLKPGDYLIDIGAEEGDFPALFASWGCKVGLMEPQAKTWPNMKMIWEANDLPTPEFTFVGFAGDTMSESGELVTNALRHNSWPACADGEVIGNHGFLNLSERPDVASITIDKLTELYGPPDALTIDVEGADYQVMLGAQDTLRDHKPQIWFSVHPEFMFNMWGKYSRELFDLIVKWGYNYELLAFDHEWHVRFWHPERHEA